MRVNTSDALNQVPSNSPIERWVRLCDCLPQSCAYVQPNAYIHVVQMKTLQQILIPWKLLKGAALPAIKTTIQTATRE